MTYNINNEFILVNEYNVEWLIGLIGQFVNLIYFIIILAERSRPCPVNF